MDAVAGGYILDLSGLSNPSEFALVNDQTGEIICYSNIIYGVLEDRSASKHSHEVITLDEYKKIFGKDPWS
ncbi:MAG: hypothetical protein Q4C36_10395 [Coriobacteriia bacterium]|nr:hypothetical protein [Coriobacteriia bacterium]